MDEKEVFEKVVGRELSLAKVAAGQYISTMTTIAFEVWKAAVKHEREACAKLCDKGVGSVGSDDWEQGYDSASRAHGAAIRARGDTK